MITLHKAVEKLRLNTSHLRSNFGVSQMSIFGSVARSQNKPSSDIDILISFTKTPSVFFLEDLKQNLYEILQTRVDIVVDNDELDRAFRNRISSEKVKV